MISRHNTSQAGFSLIEVVIALGIFVFCIIGIVGLMPVGLNAVRSVSNENNAIHIASSIQGIWEVAPINSKTTISNFITNLLVTNAASSSGNYSTDYFFNEFGEETASAGASLRMNYSVRTNASPFTNSYSVNMTFSWPPAGNATSTREFTYTICK